MKIISALGSIGESEKVSPENKKMIGDYVIIRSSMAGVFAGTLVDYDLDARTVTLQGSRRLFRWWCKQSISLDAAATYGIEHNDSKVSPFIEEVRAIFDVCEIIPTSDVCQKSILDAPIAEQS